MALSSSVSMQANSLKESMDKGEAITTTEQTSPEASATTVSKNTGWLPLSWLWCGLYMPAIDSSVQAVPSENMSGHGWNIEEDSANEGNTPKPGIGDALRPRKY